MLCIAARLLLALAVTAPLTASEGTKPRQSAAHYPVHADSPEAAIGAEYMVRSVLVEGRTAHLPDYLVIEVALFPKDRRQLMVSAARLALRVNGSKGVIYSQAPGVVAASVRYPNWENQRDLEVAAGPVILGRQPRVPRFPGDPTGPQRPPGGRSTLEDRASEEDTLISDVALREGPSQHPVSGYLYFPYRGKPAKIRRVELLYNDDSGRTLATLRLR